MSYGTDVASSVSVAIAARNAVKTEAALHDLGPKSVFIEADIATPDSLQSDGGSNGERISDVSITRGDQA